MLEVVSELFLHAKIVVARKFDAVSFRLDVATDIVHPPSAVGCCGYLLAFGILVRVILVQDPVEVDGRVGVEVHLEHLAVARTVARIRRAWPIASAQHATIARC